MEGEGEKGGVVEYAPLIVKLYLLGVYALFSYCWFG